MIAGAEEPEKDVQPCPQCGNGRLSGQLVKSAFWHGERLVLVDGIPALVCSSCGERFYDDATVTMLDVMRGDGFPADQAKAHLHVPIFFFAQRVPHEPRDAAEEEE